MQPRYTKTSSKASRMAARRNGGVIFFESNKGSDNGSVIGSEVDLYKTSVLETSGLPSLRVLPDMMSCTRAGRKKLPEGSTC